MRSTNRYKGNIFWLDFCFHFYIFLYHMLMLLSCFIISNVFFFLDGYCLLCSQDVFQFVKDFRQLSNTKDLRFQDKSRYCGQSIACRQNWVVRKHFKQIFFFQSKPSFRFENWGMSKYNFRSDCFELEKVILDLSIVAVVVS